MTKKEISSKKIESNRKNSKLGGEATKEAFRQRYLENPSYCKHCKKMLPQEKQSNLFCDRSCSASYNNLKSPKVIAKTHDCPRCGAKVKTSKTKFCSTTCYIETYRKYHTEDDLIEAIRKRNREVSANYRARVKDQTPIDADRKAIKEFYDNCPSGYEVDHIIPISKGGLHVLQNLQYLTVEENRRKSNKLV